MEDEGVGKGRETVAADHGVYFRLRSALHFREGNHSERPPRKAGSGRLGTSTTAMRRITTYLIKTDYIHLLQYSSEVGHFKLAESCDRDVISKTPQNLASHPHWPLLSG
jgi:hypothetical protein